LANERTFLAWVRTALGLAGLGVVIAKLEQGQGLHGDIAGFVLSAFGGGFLVYAFARYRRVANHLTEGAFPIAMRGPVVIGFGSLLLCIGAIVYILFGG
jgi:putative membrane protein